MLFCLPGEEEPGGRSMVTGFMLQGLLYDGAVLYHAHRGEKGPSVHHLDISRNLFIRNLKCNELPVVIVSPFRGS